MASERERNRRHPRQCDERLWTFEEGCQILSSDNNRDDSVTFKRGSGIHIYANLFMGILKTLKTCCWCWTGTVTENVTVVGVRPPFKNIGRMFVNEEGHTNGRETFKATHLWWPQGPRWHHASTVDVTIDVTASYLNDQSSNAAVYLC